MYPARGEHGRWRAVWHENGERQQCEAASEEKLAARLEKVTERPDSTDARLVAATQASTSTLRDRHSDPAR